MSDNENPLRTVFAAPVTEVTLLEDRARVVRRGQAQAEGGVMRLRIDDVAPVISDKTLIVRTREEGVRVVDSRVVRGTVSRAEAETARPESLADLEDKLDQLDDAIAQRRDERVQLEGQASAVAGVAALGRRDLATDISWGGRVDGGWKARLDSLVQRERDLRLRVVDLQADTAELEETRQRLRHRISLADRGTQRRWAAIDLELAVEQPGTYAVEIDYLVPGACWRPYHTAALSSAGDAISWQTDACVWQNTGEDWADVELHFSTERPSLGVVPPELVSDVLRVQKKSDEVVVAVREQKFETAGMGVDAASAEADLPGIDDGGDPLSLRAATRADVPSDGKPYRVSLSEFEAPAETELVALPELSPNVLLKSTQTNGGDGPILAGPVDLIRNHGLVGRTSVLFISPGERFEMGWGPEAELRLKRVVETSDEKSRMLSSWITSKTHVTVFLSNIGSKNRRLSVTERIPVSEIEKVQIELDETATTDDEGADENGFVRWTVDLPAFERTTLDLAYKIKKHEDVRGI